MKHAEEQLEITCIGDSTIDNKIWVDGLVTSFLKSRFGIERENSAIRVDKYKNSFFKPGLSVVENLIAIMPNHIIHDYTNDGFTTSDVLRGNMKDKVFPTGAFLSFPHEFFKPLVAAAENISKSQYVILSIGGNNFREFLMEANKMQGEDRKNYIKLNVNNIFAEISKEYVEIVKKIHYINPNAKIILMTQYYPSASQNKYKIYEFMHEIGEILGMGGPSCDPMEVIHTMMKLTYTQAFTKLAEEKIENLLVADITSSLNPYDKNNHVSQIEPSSIGGQRIAKMLKYIITDHSVKTGNAYRFLPEFFSFHKPSNISSLISATPIEKWVPIHPYVLKEGNNIKAMESDFFILNRLSLLSAKDKEKISTTIFKFLNTKNRFEILLERIKDVVDTYSESKSNEAKVAALSQCIHFIKDKGFLSIYSMDTPGYQTSYQTQLDRLEKLLTVMPEDEQASFLIALYKNYVNYLEEQKTTDKIFQFC